MLGAPLTRRKTMTSESPNSTAGTSLPSASETLIKVMAKWIVGDVVSVNAWKYSILRTEKSRTRCKAEKLLSQVIDFQRTLRVLLLSTVARSQGLDT